MLQFILLNPRSEAIILIRKLGIPLHANYSRDFSPITNANSFTKFMKVLPYNTYPPYSIYVFTWCMCVCVCARMCVCVDMGGGVAGWVGAGVCVYNVYIYIQSAILH